MTDCPLTMFSHRGQTYASSVPDFGGKLSPGRFATYTEAAMQMVQTLFSATGQLLPEGGAPVIFTQALLDDFLILYATSSRRSGGGSSGHYRVSITQKAVREFLQNLGFLFNTDKD
jgi:hypothetical protein